MSFWKTHRRLQRAALKDGTPGRFTDHIVECIKSGEIKPLVVRKGRIERGPDYHDFTTQKLFENLTYDDSQGADGICGHFFSDALRSNHAESVRLFENVGSAVSSYHFAEINGQVVYNALLDGLQGPESTFMAFDLVTPVDATTQHQEIIPGIGAIGDAAEDVSENQEYPIVGLNGQYIHVPEKTKDGFIIPITREAAWEDKTGQLIERANAVLQSMGITLEREVLDVVLGITTTYRRNNGAAQATYGNTHTNGDFDNLAASNALVDYTDIEAALLLFDAMVDPITSVPVTVMATDLIVPTALLMKARNIVNATAIETVDNQAAAGTVRTHSGNPLTVQPLDIRSNQFVKERTSSASDWFIGDAKGAFGYSEVWPVEVEHKDRSSDAGFSRDILMQVKASRKGVPFVKEPRKMVKCTA